MRVYVHHLPLCPWEPGGVVVFFRCPFCGEENSDCKYVLCKVLHVDGTVSIEQDPTLQHTDHTIDGSYEQQKTTGARKYPKHVAGVIASPTKMNLKPVKLHNYVRDELGFHIGGERDERALNNLRNKAKETAMAKDIPKDGWRDLFTRGLGARPELSINKS